MPLTHEGAEQRVVVDNVDWATYESLVASDGPRRGRMAYEEGTLEIMSPSQEHEAQKSLLARLIEAFADEVGIDMQLSGSTTFKRELKKRGVEADDSYYIQNEPAIRGKPTIDLDRDPPPDLAIEVEISKSALDKLGIYAALGVPELWRWDGAVLTIHWLEESGRYVERDRSRALPGLPVAELVRFLRRWREESTTRLVREFRASLRESLGKGE